MAFIFRSLLSSISDVGDLAWYFQTTSRSMLTVFRCSFGDCSTVGGTPLLELTPTNFVAMSALIFLMFVSSFGLFNITAAIFLERTMEYVAERTAKKRNRRLENDELWSVNVSRLFKTLQRYIEEEEGITDEPHHSNVFPAPSTNQRFQFAREALVGIVKNDGEVQDILVQLDIDQQDHVHLPDIADMSNSGTVTTSGLILALRRLRGPARHGEIVSVDLMVRAMQIKIDDVWAWTRSATLAAQFENSNTVTV